MTRIAVCQYAIETFSSWDAYQHKIASLVSQAKQQNAELLLLPEYAGVEIALGDYPTDQEVFAAIQASLPRYLSFFQSLAKQHQLYIQAGTIIVETSPAHYVNRAYFFGPQGDVGFQDKLQLIEYEKQLQVLQQGNAQTLFNTALGKIGIAICYDSEFPEIVRALTQAGAELILVPSYTTTVAGFNRVYLSARARAIENQCFVAVSYTVGAAAAGGAAEQTVGQAAVLGPVDYGFPDDGILAQGVMNEVMMITTDLSFEKLAQVRKRGQVRNFEDAKNKIQIPLSHSAFLWERGQG